MSYTRRLALSLPHAAAVTAVKEALAAQGFGTLTEIDVKGTLQSKIGAEIEDYTILGVCSPRLGLRVLETDRQAGVLLPCTVVVRAVDHASEVVVLDPHVLVTVPGDERLRPVAEEAAGRLDAALASLTQG